MSTASPTPAQSSSNLRESANKHQSSATPSPKRKLDEEDGSSNPPSPKRACRSAEAGIGASERLLRGGGVVDSDDEENDELVPEESPATLEEDPAAQTGESHIASNDENSSRPASSPRKSGSTNTSIDETTESTDSSPKSAADTSSSEEDSSGSTSSPRKPASTNTSIDETTESAKCSEEADNEPGSTNEMPTTPTTTASQESSSTEASEEASDMSTRMANEPPRHISGLLNNSLSCFSNSTIQFVDAAMDGHDIDMVLGEVESTAPFADPVLDLSDGTARQRDHAGAKHRQIPRSQRPD